ncbi:MAG: Maf family protein [Caulobacteraceae bacterium]
MIVLASASRARARLLRDAGAPFEAVSSGVDERAIKSRLLAEGAFPRAIAEQLAEAKALAVSAGRPGDLIVGADQTLDLNGALFDKPETLVEVRDHLRRLRGRAHVLHTATALVRDGEIAWRMTRSPRLTMRDFSDGFLDDYLARQGEALLNSLGCYHLEGMGAQLFDRTEGDWFAVLGLPLIELLAALREQGALAR